MVPSDADRMAYPSRDAKQISWGREADKSDIVKQTDIHPMVGEALCHVIFSDSRFRDWPVNSPTRYASISIYDRLVRNELRVEDSFSLGNHVVEVVVSSDEAYCKAKFKVQIPDHFMAISMRKLTRIIGAVFALVRQSSVNTLIAIGSSVSAFLIIFL